MLPFTLSSLLARTKPSARRRAPRAQEPADMGTAFGMELWLDERDHGSAAAPRPLQSVQSTPIRAEARWMPRWLQSARPPRP